MKYYCPNFNIPEVKKDFNLMSSIVGEDYAYYLWNKNNGLPIYLSEVNGKEVPNELYNTFLSEYDGNANKALLAYIIQSSKSFLRKNPEYKNLNSKDKLKYIHKYINNSDTDLETLGKDIIKKLPKGFNAEFYQSGGRNENALTIDRSTIRRYYKQVKQQTETAEELSDKITEEEKINNGRLLDAVVDFLESDFNKFVVEENGQKRIARVIVRNLQRTFEEGKYAQWTQDAITLFKGSDYTDLYHESWHQFSQLFMTPAERLALYETVKSRPSKIKIGDVEIPYHALTNRQADEVLAEEYRQYAIDRRTFEREQNIDKLGKQGLEGTENSIKNIFERIYTFLKNLFKHTQKTKVDETTQVPMDKVEKIFNDLYTNNTKPYRRSPKNITENNIARSKELTLEAITSDGEHVSTDLTSLEVGEILDAIDFWMKESLKEKGLTFAFLNNSEKKSKILPILYEEIRARFLTYKEQLNRQLDLPEVIEDANLYDVLEQRYITLQYVTNVSDVGDNWNKIVEQHQSFSKGRLFDPKNKNNKTNNEDQDQDIREADDFDEETATRDQKNKWDGQAVNPEELMSATVVELLKSLPNLDKSGNIIYSSILGLPTIADFKQTKNLLLNRLAGIRSYSKVISTLIEISSTVPHLKELIDQLPDPNKKTLTADELKLKAQFMQSLTMPSVDPISVKLHETENGFEVNTFLNNTLTTDTLFEYFDQDFKENPNRKFRTVKSENQVPTFSVSSAFLEVFDNYQNGLSSDRDVLTFYKDMFGVDLIQGNTELFDNKGMVKKNAVPYLNESTLKPIKELAIHAFNKLRLYGILNSDEKVPNDLKQALRLDSKLSPFSEFASDISNKLQKAINRLPEDSIAKKFFKDNFKQTTVFSQRKIAFDTISKVYTDYQSNSFLTSANTLEWAIRERSSILSTKQRINDAGNINELPDHLHPSVNDFVKYSAWMSKLFGEDGRRLFGQNGQLINIEINNFSDFKVGSYEGKKTTNLGDGEKFIQDFLAFLQDAVFENMRTGSKSSSFSSSVGNNRKERLYYPANDFVEEDTLVPGSVISQFRKYLEFELVRIFKNKEGRTRKEQIASNLIFFKDILSKDRRDQLQALAKNAKTEEELIRSFKLLYRDSTSGVRNDVVQSLENFFSREVDNHLEILTSSITDDNQEKLTENFRKIRYREKEYTIDDLKKIMAYYITNYVTHQIELQHILIADPTNYAIKPDDLRNNNVREIFKRLGLSTSPGKEPLIDNQDLESVNSSENELGRGIEEILIGRKRPFTTEYTAAVFNDVVSFNPTGSDDKSVDEYKKLVREDQLLNYAQYLAKSQGKSKVTSKHLEQAEEEIGKSLDTFLKQDEESNAQGYATLDFARFYLDSIGEWTSDHDDLYQHEMQVAKAIKDYRNNKTPENYNEVKRLINQSNQGIIPALKLGHYGPVTSKLDEVFSGKFSIFVMTPSNVFETDNEERMFNMYESGTDLITSVSGAKMSKPAKLLHHYKEDGDLFTINPITEENQFKLSISDLRRQQYIAPKFKNVSTLSTQMVKLAFSNFYENGRFSSELGKVKGLEDKINNLQQKFIDSIQAIVETEKSKILIGIGAKLDENGNIQSVDFKLFEKWLKSQFDKKDISSALYSYVTGQMEGFKFSLDASPQRRLIEEVIASALTKRVLRPKMFGEAYIQIASTGFNKKNTRYRNINKKNYNEITKKYGLTGFLQDYRIENGVTQPADVAVGFNPKKYGALLNLTFEDQIIGSIDKLNDILLGDTDAKKAWIEEHGKKFTMVGVRIPVQGFNSMEYFRVKMFLPESSGPVLIVPPSIITKSGSDFDIDKLFMYEPYMDSDGQLINEKYSDLNTSKEVIYKTLRNREGYKNKYNALKDLLSPYKKAAIRASKIDEELKQELIDVLNKIQSTLDKPISENYFDDFENDATQIKMKLQMIEDKQRSIFKRLYTQFPNEEFQSKLQEFTEIRNKFNEYYDYTVGNIKNIASNNLIDSFASVLSEPALFKFLTKPNESPVLKGLAEKYNVIRSAKNQITFSTMYLPRISLAIYVENALGMKSLGVDAKTNALHKLYQQTGLRFTNKDLNDIYLLKSNKQNGEIILGGMMDADKRHYISDIINEFINGHVDIEKEDWINYFNSDQARTAIILQMVLNGTPIEDALLVVNQPIVQHFIASRKGSVIKSALGIRKQKLGDYYKEITRNTELKPVYIHGFFSEAATIKSFLKNPLVRDRIAEFNVERTEHLRDEKFQPSTDVSVNAFNLKLANATEPGGLLDLYGQIALFTQFRAAYFQNQTLLELSSNIDFNTSKYRNSSDLYQVSSNIETAAKNFNRDAIDKILNNSVVSPFNITQFGSSIYDNTFDLFSTPFIQDYVKRFIDTYSTSGVYWTKDKKVTETSNFLNAIVHSLIQNVSVMEDAYLYNKYGPVSDYLTLGYNPDKSLDLILAKIKQVKDPAVQKFLAKNKFFKNLSYIEISNSGITRLALDGSAEKKVFNKFYFTTRTNDKDPDFVDAVQKDWLDAYSFNESKDEQVNSMIRDFALNVANATIFGQGFSIRYRSIQPFIPIQLTPINDAIQYIKKIKLELERNDPDSEMLKEFQEIIAHTFDVFSMKFDARAKQITPFKAYFPDYVEKRLKTVGAVREVNISSDTKGLGAELTNPTYLAKLKGNILDRNSIINLKLKFGNKIEYVAYYDFKERSIKYMPADKIETNFPIKYKNKFYADVEAAYQDNKKPYLVSKTTDKLMKELIKIKLTTYPILIKRINDEGGIDFLNKATHIVKGDPYWESTGENKFIEVLKEAYLETKDSINNADFNETDVSETTTDTKGIDVTNTEISNNSQIEEDPSDYYFDDPFIPESTFTEEPFNENESSDTSDNPILQKMRKNKNSKTNIKIGFKLSIDKKGKDQGKADLANALVTYPNPGTSSYQYMQDAKKQGIPVNDEIKLGPGVIAMASVNGNDKASDKQIEDTILTARNIIETGGTIIMDSTTDANRSWNESGEAIVQEQLGEPSGQTSKGYNYWGPNPENLNQSKVDKILSNYSKEQLLQMNMQEYINLGLSPEEINDLLKNIC